ncbi:PREDICTED: zinc finger protein 36, C3H1 type-like 1 [Bison bison bison]|uniref:Zinc finger protein 36, C3H1 type-like 1 n=1 Tax=Bison bison bison TaxID=43346 RepID=A0A6P3HR86_BISBB|nr:PREDICTED: zinc finger protein 36, C3H1 type-like 1 [Bison bison bison]
MSGPGRQTWPVASRSEKVVQPGRVRKARGAGSRRVGLLTGEPEAAPSPHRDLRDTPDPRPCPARAPKMTTTLVSATIFDLSEVLCKGNKMLNYSTPSAGGCLLDRKAVGTPAGGGFPRRHSVTLPSSKFHQNQLLSSLKGEPAPALSSRDSRFRDRSFSEGGERLLPPQKQPGSGQPRLQHSFSFAGFPSAAATAAATGLLDSPTSITPPPILSADDLLGSPTLPDGTNNPFAFSSQELASLFAPSMGLPGGGSPTTFLFRPMSESPHMFDSPPSPQDSLSDQEGYLSSSSSSHSGSDSPTLDNSRRLPIFSRLSISDD